MNTLQPFFARSFFSSLFRGDKMPQLTTLIVTGIPGPILDITLYRNSPAYFNFPRLRVLKIQEDGACDPRKYVKPSWEVLGRAINLRSLALSSQGRMQDDISTALPALSGLSSLQLNVEAFDGAALDQFTNLRDLSVGPLMPQQWRRLVVPSSVTNVVLINHPFTDYSMDWICLRQDIGAAQLHSLTVVDYFIPGWRVLDEEEEEEEQPHNPFNSRSLGSGLFLRLSLSATP
jgi:hypothetical protein